MSKPPLRKLPGVRKCSVRSLVDIPVTNLPGWATRTREGEECGRIGIHVCGYCDRACCSSHVEDHGCQGGAR